MSEANQESQSSQPETSQSGDTGNQEQTLSLDDLYGEFQPQERQTPQSAQQQQAQPGSHDQSGNQYGFSYDNIPDPVNDADGFKSYLGNIQKELAAARSEAQTVQSRLQQKEQELSAQAEERDFRNVAEEIAKTAEVDPELVEAGLLHKYVKDKQFQQMWQNRDQNPNAFKKVKGVLTNEMKNRFTTKVDPQIAENQRAAEEADKGAEGKKKDDESLEDQLMKADPREFDRMIGKIRGNSSL